MPPPAIDDAKRIRIAKGGDGESARFFFITNPRRWPGVVRASIPPAGAGGHLYCWVRN